MSITPAFSPGPWITQGALVGSVRRWIFEDLYEQCSFHIAEKMPSSVKVGVRPMSARMRSYSSGLRPWAATSAGVMRGGLGGVLTAMPGELLTSPFRERRRRRKGFIHTIFWGSSRPQRLLGNGDPLGLDLADVLGGTPHLGEHVGEQPLGLRVAPEPRKQHGPAHARLGTGVVVGDRAVLVERLAGAAARLQRPGVEQMALGRLVVGPAL